MIKPTKFWFTRISKTTKARVIADIGNDTFWYMLIGFPMNTADFMFIKNDKGEYFAPSNRLETLIGYRFDWQFKPFESRGLIWFRIKFNSINDAPIPVKMYTDAYPSAEKGMIDKLEGRWTGFAKFVIGTIQDSRNCINFPTLNPDDVKEMSIELLRKFEQMFGNIESTFKGFTFHNETAHKEIDINKKEVEDASEFIESLYDAIDKKAEEVMNKPSVLNENETISSEKSKDVPTEKISEKESSDENIELNGLIRNLVNNGANIAIF